MKKFLENPKAEAEEKPKEAAWADEPRNIIVMSVF